MSEDFLVFEMDNGAYIISVAWFPTTGVLSIAPEFRMAAKIPLGDFLRGLGITLDDCKKALEEQQ